MKQIRTISLFILACSVLCFVIAIERYLSAVRTGKEIAAALEGIEYESVRVPIETTVCGLAGVVLLVTGAKLLFDSVFNSKSNSDQVNGLLKPDVD